MTPEARQRKLKGLIPNMGRGRPKGVLNKITKEHKELAAFLLRNEAMEKAELLARLSRQARSDIGKHLKIADGTAEVYIDPEHTDTIREITVKRTADEAGISTETRLKVADPVAPLRDIAEILGLKKLPAPTVDMSVLVQMLQVNVEPGRLHEAVIAALRQED